MNPKLPQIVRISETKGMDGQLMLADRASFFAQNGFFPMKGRFDFGLGVEMDGMNLLDVRESGGPAKVMDQAAHMGDGDVSLPKNPSEGKNQNREAKK